MIKIKDILKRLNPKKDSDKKDELKTIAPPPPIPPNKPYTFADRLFPGTNLPPQSWQERAIEKMKNDLKSLLIDSKIDDILKE